MNAVVRTAHLTKDFSVGFWRQRPRRALDGLSMEIGRGEVFGLLGSNGAGKTTTLKLLLQLLWPTSGTVELLGRSPGDPSIRARLGFLPEQPIFYDHLTAAELLDYFAGLFGMTGAERRRKVDAAFERVALDRADCGRPLRQFSKGMLQRVGLAQALVNDPELIVLDEPMSGLDPVGRRDVREIILRLRDEGRTVLFSSHILSDAEAVCSRVAILSRGRMAACGTIAELTSAASTGWEIVVSGVDAATAARFTSPTTTTMREMPSGQITFRVGISDRPEPIIAALASAGATLDSVTPLRTSLEDVFLSHVRTTSTDSERGQ